MKFKSKSLISIILSIMMVISMILVAIPANAAVIVSEPVGAGDYYLWYGIDQDNPSNWESVRMIQSGSSYVATTDSGKQWAWTYFFITNGDSKDSTDSVCWPTSKDSTLNKDALSAKQAEAQYKDNLHSYKAYQIHVNTANLTYSFSYDGSDTVTVSEGSSTPTTNHTVSKGTETHGKFTVSPTSAAQGDTVTVTTTPDSGYEVDTVTYTYGTTTSNASGSGNTYTFTMPASDVSVNVTFRESATPTTTYYLGGRIKQDDSDTWCTYENKSYPFDETETPGLYKYVSNQTAKAWSGTRGQSNLLQYFFVHKGISKDWYGCSDTDGVAAALTTANQSVSLTNYTSDNDTKEARLTYIKSTDDTGNVIFYLDTNNGMKLYYEVEGGSTTKGAFEIKDKTAVNGSLTFSADGKTAGTADAGNTVNVTAKPYAGFTCSGITVSYTNKTTSETVTLASTGSGNSYTFVVPDDLTTAITESISVAATFTLDKSAYIATKGDGLWIDVAPNENDSTATLIKWNNYSGNNQGTSTNPYTFYVPKNVVLANATVYNGFDSEVKLNGVSIPANSCNTQTLSLTAGTTYNKDNDNTYTVKVMQGSTNAMFLYTTKGDAAYSLPTKTGVGETKASVKSDGGSCKTMTDTTDTAKQFSAAMALDSVKGRGNSSWEASNKLFGKYAFNMKLGSKTKLFGMDSAKSWCLLANNADESMMRNALTYQLAAEIGIQDSPEFRFVDIYDNGEYLGAYLVTEKVDVGNSKLVKGESFDDINEKAANKNVDEGTNRGTYTYNDKQYNMQYVNVLPSGSNTSTIDYDKKGKYLLEFELKKRLFPSDGDEKNTASEASWFRSPRGQYVVVKSPEFATKEQVTYIAQKFAAMEAMIFTSGATKAQLSSVMDVESFAKMYLIQEFSSNLDSAATSYYMTFDCAQTNPVFVANPVWDYDWAYGQYEKQVKEDVNGTRLDSANPKAWFAKSKQIGDNEAENNNKYSIQSQLATNNSDFKSVVRKVWEETNGFYDKIKTYYAADGQIDTWYNQIEDSVNMNETRWGFIANDPLIKGETGNGGSDSWGSKNTGANHLEAVNYLKTNWTETRATWLNTELTKEPEYKTYTPDVPTIKAYAADGTTEISAVEAGSPFIIKVTSNLESGVVYRLYKGGVKVGTDQSDGKFEIATDESMVGETYTYTIRAVYGGRESSDSTGVEITINEKAGNKTVRVYFKSAAASAYVPSFSLDNSAATVMSRTRKTPTENGTYFGSTYSGSLKFYWFFKDITIDTSVPHTITFTTKNNVNATTSYPFGAATEYYFAVDNLMGDTNLVDLTGEKEYIRNYHISATHMVYSTTTDNNAGFTWINGKEYAMGTYLPDNNISTASLTGLTSSSLLTIPSALTPNAMLEASSAPSFFTIKSATLAQRITAEAEEVSTLQYQLLDVNLDGVVDVKDSTMMQKALAGF